MTDDDHRTTPGAGGAVALADKIGSYAKVRLCESPSGEPGHLDWLVHERDRHLITKALGAYAALPAPRSLSLSGQELEARVALAMTDAWNEICSDTGCHPDDIERNFEGRRGHLGFTPKHWARAVALRLAPMIAEQETKP